MSYWYKGKCEECSRDYKGQGKRFCSQDCFKKFIHKKSFRGNEKFCNSCNKWKPISEFRKDNSQSNGLSTYCSECKDLKRCDYGRTAEGVWRILKKRNKDICKKELFILWYKNQEKKCVYCDITEEDWIKLYSEKHIRTAKRLTIDRMNNDLGYVLDNLALACYHCNFIKGELFNFNEMKELGQKYIKTKWQKQTMEVANV